MVVGMHGHDGRLRIQPSTDNPERFRKGARLHIAGEAYTVGRVVSGQAGHLLMDLVGLDTQEEAAVLLHEPVVVPAEDVPEPPSGTYYHYQLIDMTVKDPSGAVLGRLSEVLSTGANDVYVVTGDASELMVPALADVVVDDNVAAGEMTVALPEGIEPRALSPAKAPKRPNRRVRRSRPSAS